MLSDQLLAILLRAYWKIGRPPPTELFPGADPAQAPL